MQCSGKRGATHRDVCEGSGACPRQKFIHLDSAMLVLRCILNKELVCNRQPPAGVEEARLHLVVASGADTWLVDVSMCSTSSTDPVQTHEYTRRGILAVFLREGRKRLRYPSGHLAPFGLRLAVQNHT